MIMLTYQFSRQNSLPFISKRGSSLPPPNSLAAPSQAPVLDLLHLPRLSVSENCGALLPLYLSSQVAHAAPWPSVHPPCSMPRLPNHYVHPRSLLSLPHAFVHLPTHSSLSWHLKCTIKKMTLNFGYCPDLLISRLSVSVNPQRSLHSGPRAPGQYLWPPIKTAHSACSLPLRQNLNLITSPISITTTLVQVIVGPFCPAPGYHLSKVMVSSKK